MQQESIEIKTSKERFFLEYLTLKKPVIDAILSKINKEKVTLSDLPMKVLAQLLYYNDSFKDLPEQQRWDQLFSKETKDQICENLAIPEHHLNIYFSKLRKIKILNGKTISKLFIVYANDISLNFKFKLNGHI